MTLKDTAFARGSFEGDGCSTIPEFKARQKDCAVVYSRLNGEVGVNPGLTLKGAYAQQKKFLKDKWVDWCMVVHVLDQKDGVNRVAKFQRCRPRRNIVQGT